jgi:hypothetical protein
MPPSETKRIEVKPPVERLAFSIRVPGDFQQVPLPEETQDFSNPTAMMPLGVFMASYGVVLCTVAARPAYDDGSVMDWAMYLCGQQQGFQVKKLMPERRWGTQVVEAEATQPSEAGEMTVRAIFFEDGGRLFNVGVMAPSAIWPSVKETLEGMLASFALMHVEGPTRPIATGTPLPAKAAFDREGEPSLPAVAAPTMTEPPQQRPRGVDETPLPDMTAYALADAGALDMEDDINARFREAGAGLVPNVLQRDEAKRCVVVGAGAIETLLPVPAGWHVVDDGRRTLVFDRGNRVQVNLNLFRIEGQSPSQIFTEILEGLTKESPGVEHRVMEIEGMNAMQVRNLVIDGESLEQAYLLKRLGEELGLKVRITATGEDLPRAADMTGEMLKGMRWMGAGGQQ